MEGGGGFDVRVPCLQGCNQDFLMGDSVQYGLDKNGKISFYITLNFTKLGGFVNP